MFDHTFECVWPEPSNAVKNEVVAFWLEESAMLEGVARERAEQLLVVCRDSSSDARVAAVSTAIPTLIERLGLRCFYFRAFVGHQHRSHGLRATTVIQKLLRRSYDVLNERHRSGIDRDVVGLYLEIQNANLQRRRQELVWTDLGANIFYAGVLPSGGHARVWYFEDARLPI